MFLLPSSPSRLTLNPLYTFPISPSYYLYPAIFLFRPPLRSTFTIMVSVIILGYLLSSTGLELETSDEREHSTLVFLGLVTSFSRIFDSSIYLSENSMISLLYNRIV